MSRVEPLSNPREYLFAGDRLNFSGAHFLEPPLGHGYPFLVNLGVRRIEGSEERVDYNRAFLYRKRRSVVYYLSCAWHIDHLMFDCSRMYYSPWVYFNLKGRTWA